MSGLIWFSVGAIVGSVIGLFVAALCMSAARGDQR